MQLMSFAVYNSIIVFTLTVLKAVSAQSDTVSIITPLLGSIVDSKNPLNLTWSYNPNGGAQPVQMNDVYTVNLMFLPSGPTSGRRVATLSYLTISTLTYNLTLPKNTTSGTYAIAMVKDKNYFSSPSFQINGIAGSPVFTDGPGSGATNTTSNVMNRTSNNSSSTVANPSNTLAIATATRPALTEIDTTPTESSSSTSSGMSSRRHFPASAKNVLFAAFVLFTTTALFY